MPIRKDITGQRFGRLVAESFAYKKKAKTYWYCKCDCGNRKAIRTENLNKGCTQSCGCLAFLAIGEKRNRLTLKALAGKNRRGLSLGLFDCDCGKAATTLIAEVKSGHTKSCGCLGAAPIIDKTTLRKCLRCKQDKPVIGNFYKRKDKPTYRYTCNECRSNDPYEKLKRRIGTLKKYDLTPAQYAERYNAQNGNCDICGKHRKCLAVDHCHVTGVIRALLCLKCNTAIGMLNDDPAILEKAIVYLNLYRSLAPWLLILKEPLFPK